jgi:hypothetical protein
MTPLAPRIAPELPPSMHGRVIARIDIVELEPGASYLARYTTGAHERVAGVFVPKVTEALELARRLVVADLLPP